MSRSEVVVVRYLLVLLSVLLSACAVPYGEVPGYVKRWDGSCYRDLKGDVLVLSSKVSKDCGFLPLSSGEYSRGLVLACVKEAETKGEPYHVGYEGFGEDSGYCSVVVKDADGQRWSLYFDGDVTGQLGLKGNHSAIWIQRCSSVEFSDGWFSLVGCKEDKSKLAKVLSERK